MALFFKKNQSFIMKKDEYVPAALHNKKLALSTIASNLTSEISHTKANLISI
jgi:hypothetical protein